jgi:PAS domain S-box-containing protein
MPAEKYNIFDKMIEGIQIIDREWRYVYVNDTVAMQGKSSREELLGHTMMDKYPGIENSEMFGFLRSCMKEGTPHQMVNEFDFPDGSKGYFELRMQRVDEGVLIMSFDVTKQKLAEKYLMDTNSVLEEMVRKRTLELTVKNKELEQFAYIASHDLQEPLRTVSNYIQVFEEDYKDKLDDTATGYLNSMSRATRRMSNLAKALLDFSRLGRNRKLTLVNLSGLIEDVKADLESFIKSSGTVIKIDGKMPELNVYEPEMRQIFQNLIGNAIKFRDRDRTPEIVINAEPAWEKWKFCVSDNGIGIEPVHYDRIFHIFQRLYLNEKYDGDGIGLANSKKIAELHGGEIWVESVLGKGSKFFFTVSKL